MPLHLSGASPLSADQTLWTNPNDYAACQALAREARDTGTALLRTISVCDAMRDCNIVVLDPLAFAEVSPRSQRTWHSRFEDGRLTAFAAFPRDDRVEFTFADFGLGVTG